jgi:hypothetical protein
LTQLDENPPGVQKVVEPGSKKVYWPAESFWIPEGNSAVFVKQLTVSADNSILQNFIFNVAKVYVSAECDFCRNLRKQKK